MQKGQALILILVAILIIAALAVGAYYLGRLNNKPQSQNPVVTSQTPQPIPSPSVTPMVSNFNLIFRYGVGAKNELDTFKGIYTKDLITDAPISTQLILSPEELNKIYQKMKDINFFDYPEKFTISIPPGSIIEMTTPYPSYYFKVQYDLKMKEVLWERDDIVSPLDKRTIKLRELINVIKEIIESKEEYKKLPLPKGGYL